MSTTFGVKVKDNVVEVAFRSNGIRFINELAELLIGDVKKEIEKTDSTAEYWRTVPINKPKQR
jgi:hypothetical protein